MLKDEYEERAVKTIKALTSDRMTEEEDEEEDDDSCDDDEKDDSYTNDEILMNLWYDVDGTSKKRRKRCMKLTMGC